MVTITIGPLFNNQREHVYSYIFSITIWLNENRTNGLELQKIVELENVPNLRDQMNIDNIDVTIAHMIWLHNKDRFFVILEEEEANSDIDLFENLLEMYKDDGWKPAYTFHEEKKNRSAIKLKTYKDGIPLH